MLHRAQGEVTAAYVSRGLRGTNDMSVSGNMHVDSLLPRFGRGALRLDEENSHMRFTWPVRDKTHVVYAELANFLAKPLLRFSEVTLAARHKICVFVGKCWVQI